MPKNKFLSNRWLKLKPLSIFLPVLILLVFAGSVPYVNLIFTPVVSIIVLYMLAVFLFKISSKGNIFAALILLVTSIPWLLVGSRAILENVGVLIFVALLIATFQKIKEMRDLVSS